MKNPPGEPRRHRFATVIMQNKPNPHRLDESQGLVQKVIMVQGSDLGHGQTNPDRPNLRPQDRWEWRVASVAPRMFGVGLPLGRSKHAVILGPLPCRARLCSGGGTLMRGKSAVRQAADRKCEMERKRECLTSGTSPKTPLRVPYHMLPGQPPAWQISLGQGPLGQVSQAWLDALLRPTAKPENNLVRSELSHFSQSCFRDVPAFSRNFVTLPQSLHLYSNIGTTVFSFLRINSLRLRRAPANRALAARRLSRRLYCTVRHGYLQPGGRKRGINTQTGALPRGGKTGSASPRGRVRKCLDTPRRVL